MSFPERAFRPVSNLEILLRKWGWAFGERPPKEWAEGDGPSYAVSPIARAMEFAPGRNGKGTVGRSASAMSKLRGTPAFGFDPVVCTETRSKRIATPDDIPADIQRVQTAALALHAVDPVRGRVLRTEYCRLGSQHDKAERLGLKIRRYRDELAHARTWMAGRLTLT